MESNSKMGQIQFTSEDEKIVIYNRIKKVTERNKEYRTMLKRSIIINIALILALVVLLIGFTIRNNKLVSELNSLNQQITSLDTLLSDSIAAREKFVSSVEENQPEIKLNYFISRQNEKTENVDMQKFEDIPLRDDVKEYIYTSAIEAEIPPEILFSVAWNESRYTVDAKSETNDHGLFQINEENFEWLANSLGYSTSEFGSLVYDPFINCDAAVFVLRTNIEYYHNDNWHHVLMRYNLGPNGAEDYFEEGQYSTKYSRDTLNYAEETFNFTDIEI